MYMLHHNLYVFFPIFLNLSQCEDWIVRKKLELQELLELQAYGRRFRVTVNCCYYLKILLFFYLIIQIITNQ